MARKSIIEVIKEVKHLLEMEGTLSTRQISIKTHSQWRTVHKALEVLTFLEIIQKQKGSKTERMETSYSIKD